jgi:hypothetical protein
VCVNTLGSYVCKCAQGFYRTNRSCVDINECHFDLHDCYSAAECHNSIGSFYCECNQGFYGDGKICEGLFYFRSLSLFLVSKSNFNQDLNECEISPGVCVNGICLNWFGSYSCGYNTPLNYRCKSWFYLFVLLSPFSNLKHTTVMSANGHCTKIGDQLDCRCEKGFQKVGNQTEQFVCSGKSIFFLPPWYEQIS